MPGLLRRPPRLVATLAVTSALVAWSPVAATPSGPSVDAPWWGLRDLPGTLDPAELGIPTALGSTLVLSPATEVFTETGEIASGALSVDGPGGLHRELDLADEAPEEPSGGLELFASFKHETPRWYAASAALPSAGEEAFVRVHGQGAVYAMNGPREMRWSRPAMSFYPDWEVEDPLVVPLVLLGVDPLNPLALVSENPYAVGDVTGDGFEDVVVSHYVWHPEPATGSYVSVLDGRTGETVAWKRFAGLVMHVVLANLDHTASSEIVVTQEPGGGATGLVHALRGGSLEPMWTHDTGTASGLFIHAGRVQADPARIALSVTGKGFGQPAPKGQLVVLKEDGTPVWKKDTTGWVRTFRADPAGASMVAQELADRTLGPGGAAGIDDFSYRLKWLNVATGAQMNLEAPPAVRQDAVMIPLEVGNIDGDGQTEWVVGELALNPVTKGWWSTRVVAIEAKTVPTVQWTYEVPADQRETPHSLSVAGGSQPRVIVAAFKGYLDPLLVTSDTLFALDGKAAGTAHPLWRVNDQHAMPAWSHLTSVDGSPALMVGQTGLGGAMYRLTDGARVADLALLAEPLSAHAVDVDEDGTQDLLTGGTSGIVMALDGNALHPRYPGAVWRTAVNGPVRELALADVVGDATPEVVAAATSHLAVLRLSDGRVLWSRQKSAARPAETFWTIATGDLNGDGHDDVVAPGQRLMAFDGRTGTPLWTFDPPTAVDASYFSSAVVADANGDGAGDVAAEYSLELPSALAPRHVARVVAIDGRSGAALWQHNLVQPRNIPQLWRSVITYEDQGAPKFGFTYLVGNGAVGALGGWSPQVSVYDARTGALDWTSGAGPVYQRMLTMTSPRGGKEVLDFGWQTLARATPQGWTMNVTPSIWDAEFAELLPGQTELVTGYNFYVHVYDGDLPWDPGAGADPIATWPELGNQSMTVADMDGDGVDEILSYAFDFESWVKALTGEGIGVAGGGINLPKGLAILEARPA